MDKTILISLPVEDLQAIIVDCVSSCLKYQPKERQSPPNNSLTAEDFCTEKRYMALNTFYQRAPKGLVPGAFKVGARWFVDVREFERVTKEKS